MSPNIRPLDLPLAESRALGPARRRSRREASRRGVEAPRRGHGRGQVARPCISCTACLPTGRVSHAWAWRSVANFGQGGGRVRRSAKRSVPRRVKQDGVRAWTGACSRLALGLLSAGSETVEYPVAHPTWLARAPATRLRHADTGQAAGKRSWNPPHWTTGTPVSLSVVFSGNHAAWLV
jgi:hypothetical protein